MLKRVWAQTQSTSTWKPKVEEHEFRDGSKHYSFRDRFGRPSDLADEKEAQQVIREFKMTDVTEEMIRAGWIKG